MEMSRNTSLQAAGAPAQPLVWPNDPLFPVQWHLHNTGNTPYSVAGYDINVLPVWPDYTGKGRLVAVLDDAMDETHPDLIANYRADLAWNLSTRESTAQWYPWQQDLGHGVATAGLIAATANNGLGGVGVAWDAQITAHRFDLPSIRQIEEVYVLFYDGVDKVLEQGIEIYNNSWGTNVPYPVAADWQAYAHAAARDLVELGRDGLGIITVFSAGNARKMAHDTNYDPVVSMPWVIAVAAGGQDGGVVS
ncbi:S8 family serine peptidase, partial [Yanghanlia caeni]|nr:S8 family serine peptidase [Alcaligenaceae bacterium LG-2]